MRKKIYKKYIAVAVAVMTACSMSASPAHTSYTANISNVYAADENEDKDEDKDKEEETGKEETVYVISDSDGDVEKTIVEEWLKNPDGKDVLSDTSSLQDIQNVKGEESFTQNGRKINWKADGKDIYYQGTTDAELPVGGDVKYYLDDNKI